MKFIIICILTVLLQTTFVNLINIGGKPDLTILVLTVISLKYGTSKGMGCGMLIGLLEDVYSFSGFGTHLIIKTFLGWGIGSLKNKIFFDNYFLQILIVFIMCISDMLIFIIFKSVFTADFDISGIISSKSVEGVIYTSLLSPLFFKLFVYGKTDAKRIYRV